MFCMSPPWRLPKIRRDRNRIKKRKERGDHSSINSSGSTADGHGCGSGSGGGCGGGAGGGQHFMSSNKSGFSGDVLTRLPPTSFSSLESPQTFSLNSSDVPSSTFHPNCPDGNHDPATVGGGQSISTAPHLDLVVVAVRFPVLGGGNNHYNNSNDNNYNSNDNNTTGDGVDRGGCGATAGCGGGGSGCGGGSSSGRGSGDDNNAGKPCLGSESPVKKLEDRSDIALTPNEEKLLYPGGVRGINIKYNDGNWNSDTDPTQDIGIDKTKRKGRQNKDNTNDKDDDDDDDDGGVVDEEGVEEDDVFCDNNVRFSDYYLNKVDPGWWGRERTRHTTSMSVGGGGGGGGLGVYCGGGGGGVAVGGVHNRNNTTINLISSSSNNNNNNGNDYSSSQADSMMMEGDKGELQGLTRFVLMGSKLEAPPGTLNRSDTNHVKRTLENVEYEPNPDVAPYQAANFIKQNSILPFPLKRSSTILKKVPIPKRHLDTFGGYEYNFMGKRGVMLHTDRYQVDFIKSFDGMTQRERLQAGLNYVEAMRGTKRRRELVPHRAQLDLILGGKQIEFEERFYIQRELQKLKALAMPDVAKDLYHGRGIHLPFNHNSLKPRYPLPNDIEDECMASAPSSLQTVLRRNESSHEFPRIDRDPTFIGRGCQLRTKSILNRHPQLPSIRGRPENSDFNVIRTSGRLATRGRLRHDVTSLSRSHTQAPPPSRDNGHEPTRLLTKGRSNLSPQRKAAPAVDISGLENQEVPESKSDRPDDHKLPTLVPGAPESGVGGGQIDGSPHEAASSNVPSETVINTNDGGNLPETQARLRPSTEEGLNRTTPNPLRGADFIQSVPQDEQEELRQTFQRLDTDMDGHIKYNQLKTQLPKAFSWEQERYIEEVYNLTNSITFFGVDEFMAMDRLSKTVEGLTGKARDAYESIDFLSISDELLKYVSKFDTSDSGNHGTVTIDALQRILSETVTSAFSTDSALWDEVLDTISVDYGAKTTKISFIAHIPLFLSLESEYKN